VDNRMPPAEKGKKLDTQKLYAHSAVGAQRIYGLNSSRVANVSTTNSSGSVLNQTEDWSAIWLKFLRNSGELRSSNALTNWMASAEIFEVFCIASRSVLRFSVTAPSLATISQT